jgi:hypothetical protein
VQTGLSVLFRYICIIAVCSRKHTNGVNTLRGQHAEIDGACQRTGHHTLWLRWRIETRVSAMARETSVLGTSAFEAPSFLHMGTRIIAILLVQRSQEMFAELVETS